MKKSILVIGILIILGVMRTEADDGSWNNSFSVQGGSIYSDIDHPEIALEKELLIFDGAKTTVFFLFRNTSGRQVTVTGGFPVRHEIETVDYGDYLEIPTSPYGGDSIQALSWFETVELCDPEKLDEPAYSLPEGILINDFNNSREFISPEDTESEIDFVITGNGKPVHIDAVLLEREASRLGAAVTYHFRHHLVFEPRETAVIKVEYRQNLVAGSDGMSDFYRWDYVIGTGSTWKGSIGSFLLIIPGRWQGELPGLEILSETEGFKVYGAADYEPGRIDTFSLRAWGTDYMELYMYRDKIFPELKRMWLTGAKEVMQEIQPVQEFVRSVTASSFLPDRVNVFNEGGVVDRAGFDPVAAFDGLGETSWCEGVPGDGIGEYIECTLMEPVWAVGIKNGFTRFPARDWMFESGDFEKYIRDEELGLKDYYIMNSRVQRLEISSADGETRYSLELEDGRDPQNFAGIFLEPGTWRFTIRSVYSGALWKNTCVAEILFFPRPTSPTFAEYLEDPFYRDHLSCIRY